MTHRALFSLDPAVTFLNHGSFGAMPLPIQRRQQAFRDQLERAPVQFLVNRVPALLDDARHRVAKLIGAPAEEIAFVRNATAGVNAVLGALTLRPGERILTTDHRYKAVGHTLAFRAKQQGAHLDIVEIPFPLCDAETVLDRIEGALRPETRLVVLDQITSATALVMPVRRVAAMVASRPDCMLLVDGAHAPGHLELNVETMGADFWVGNLHKWPCAPKGCAVLWVPQRHQGWVQPTVISNHFHDGFHRKFDWCGTDDPSPWLTAPAAIELHETFGGAAFRAENIALSWQAVQRLCDRLDLEPGAGSPALRCAMGAVELPHPASERDAIYRALLERNIEVVVHPFNDRLFLRLSAFSAYNTIEDYDRLADALAEIL
ncbi:MAG: aminotransferase class V-fold PLP-dependent enzyme [Myxococcota bacterium]